MVVENVFVINIENILESVFVGNSVLEEKCSFEVGREKLEYVGKKILLFGKEE